MGIIARQSLQNAAITYLGIALGALLTLILYPRILSPEQYGLTRILISASLLGAQFSHLGMRNTIIRFFPLFRRISASQNGLFFLAVAVPLAGFLLFTLLFLLLRNPVADYYSDRSPLFIDYIYYLLPITFSILYSEILNSWLRSLRDSISGAFVSDLLHRILLITLLLFHAFSGMPFRIFILLFTLTYLLQPILLFLLLARREEIDLRPRFDILRRSLSRRMASYGLFTLMGGFTTVMVGNIDVMMLGALSGLDQTAVYAVAFYIGIVIAVPQRAVERIATPLVSDWIRKKNWDRIRTLYHKTSLVQTITGCAILLMVAMNSRPLLDLLPEIYGAGNHAILLIGLGKLFGMAAGINGSIILTSRHYRFDLYTNLFLIVLAAALNLLLIPPLGVTGAALATMISIFIYNLAKLLFVWKAFSMQPFTHDHLLVALFALLTAGAGWLLPEMHLAASIPATSLVLLMLFLLPIRALDLSPDLNRLADRLFGFRKKMF